jgi:hypothetical protein
MTSQTYHEKMDKESVSQGKTELRRQLESLLVACKQTVPPVNLDRVARYCGIVAIVESDVNAHGLLIPTEAGFRVEINTKLHPVRKRSTLAHEIAHTFLYDSSSSPPTRKRVQWLDHPWREEGICSEIARQLLVPSSMLKSSIGNSQKNSETEPLTIEVMEKLASQYLVSLDIIARRLQDDKLSDAVFIFFEQRGSVVTPSRPMFSSGRLRVAGICSFIINNATFQRECMFAVKNSQAKCDLTHPELGMLKVTCKRINSSPLRILALATR